MVRKRFILFAIERLRKMVHIYFGLTRPDSTEVDKLLEKKSNKRISELQCMFKVASIPLP